jgi:hypothetical protein
LQDCPGIDAWGPLRWESEETCEAPDSVCVEADEQAACVAAPATSCTTDQAPVCANDTDFFECDSIGYLEEQSCGPDYGSPCEWTDATGWACVP